MEFRHLPEMYRADYDRDIAADQRDTRAHVAKWMRRQADALHPERRAAIEAKDAKAYHRCEGRLKVFTAALDHLYDDQTPDSLRTKAADLDALAQQRHDNGSRLLKEVYAVRCQAAALREVAAEWERDLTERTTVTDEAWRREDAEYGGEDPDAPATVQCTARQLAERLGVSLSTIYRRCRAGILAAAKTTAGRWSITVPATA